MIYFCDIFLALLISPDISGIGRIFSLSDAIEIDSMLVLAKSRVDMGVLQVPSISDNSIAQVYNFCTKVAPFKACFLEKILEFF